MVRFCIAVLICCLMVSAVCADENFYASEIDDVIFARIKGKSYKDDCIVPLSDLRYLHVLHIGFDGETHEGEMICNAAIAGDMLDIFKKLYEAKYQIEKIRLVDEYNADDETSMRDNNSSSFNFRFISHTKKVSNHGYGLAVDINTLTEKSTLSLRPPVSMLTGAKIFRIKSTTMMFATNFSFSTALNGAETGRA